MMSMLLPDPAAAGRDRLAQLESLRPHTPVQLHRFLRRLLGVRVPRQAVAAGSCAPLDYLAHCFFEPADAGPASPDRLRRDAIVWACRGGGKTFLGAAATLLDLIYKPGIQVRILGGSLEQSARMYRYLLHMLDRPALGPLLAGRPTRRRIELIHGSAVEVLSQSHRSVRGVRVHKLRCDEVELFNPQIWEAAQLVTRSGECGPVRVFGAVEALSTMHRPFGLMSRIIEQARVRGVPVFRWSALDVAQRCGPSHACVGCGLWEGCRGVARGAGGFVPIDDLLAQRQRCSDEVWASEMLCQRPQRSDSVYPMFRPAAHVGRGEPDLRVAMAGESRHGDRHDDAGGQRGMVVGGMDFGLRSPLVMLWAWVDVRPAAPPREWPVHVFDEHVARELTLEQHLASIADKPWPRPRWLAVDPAGTQRNSQTGLTDVQCLRRAGYRVRHQRGLIRDGIEAVRRRLDRQTLRVHPACKGLIEALSCYHFDVDRPHDQTPVKDGPDHLCDALRYLVMNLEVGSVKIEVRRYT